MSTFFESNSPTVISEVVDGQLVLVNFDNGCYYSANPAGTAVWEALVGGVAVEAIIKGLSPEVGDTDVRAFVAELEGQGLLRASSNGAVEQTWRAPEEVALERPVLQMFDDMAEMLLLDPIHDVDQSGWPQAPIDD